jgi:hypothetical protein
VKFVLVVEDISTGENVQNLGEGSYHVHRLSVPPQDRDCNGISYSIEVVIQLNCISNLAICISEDKMLMKKGRHR